MSCTGSIVSWGCALICEVYNLSASRIFWFVYVPYASVFWSTSFSLAMTPKDEDARCMAPIAVRCLIASLRVCRLQDAASFASDIAFLEFR